MPQPISTTQSNNHKFIMVAQGETGHGDPQVTHAEGAGGETHAGAEHGEEHGGSPLTHHKPWEFSVSGLIVAIVVVTVFATITGGGSKLKKIPGRAQAFAELVVEFLRNFTKSGIGPGGERFTTLIGSLFIFIFCSNLFGALPLLSKGKVGDSEVSPWLPGPMANISMTFGLAFIVFCVVQYTAIKEQGVGPRFAHLAGPVGWLAPLIFPLELFGELVRPLSLSLRLFGNIFGEEMIVGILVGLLSLLPYGIGIFLPLHMPIVAFGLLTALVQATVFCLLSCVYLQLAMEKHDHGHDDHDHGHDHAHGDHAPAH